MHRTLALAVLTSAVVGAQGAPPPSIRVAALDRQCKPCDDFWRFANGTWLDQNPIPAAYQSWGPSQIMARENRANMRTILEAAAADRTARPDTNPRRLGDFYASCMDTAAVNARGIAPIRGDLDRIDAIRSTADLVAVLVRFEGAARPSLLDNGTVIGPFRLTSGLDAKDPSRVIARVVERDSAGRTPSSILSMPDRDYYLNEDPKTRETRDAFLQHATRLLTFAGSSADAAATQARVVLAFESDLATSLLRNADRRDPERTYHLMTLAGLTELAPAYNWRALFQEARLAETTPVNVAEPELLKKTNQLLTTAPIDQWKVWLRWRVIKVGAPYLSEALAAENFRFERTVLAGVAEPLPRWETCAQFADRDVADALGEAWVAKHFPPESKRRMTELVENVRAAMRDEIMKSEWMQPETKRGAVEKLTALKVQIGYPDRWHDYAGMKIDRGAFFENVRAAWAWGQRYEWSKIGKPVSYVDWAMTAPTVNAYSNSIEVKIVLPAGYLQPPYFSASADDAVNYAGIGTTIGHEMGHQFDDGGSKYDATGRLRNWWTDEDRTRFDARATCVLNQFNAIDVGEGLRHNGKLVLGEALGDLGGLTVAYRAYRRSIAGKPETAIDGYSPDQRFFIAFAQKWGTQWRPEAIRLQLATDNHPLSKYRANATLANMPEFQRAFQCAGGDAMMRPPAEQCWLW